MAQGHDEPRLRGSKPLSRQEGLAERQGDRGPPCRPGGRPSRSVAQRNGVNIHTPGDLLTSPHTVIEGTGHPSESGPAPISDQRPWGGTPDATEAGHHVEARVVPRQRGSCHRPRIFALAVSGSGRWPPTAATHRCRCTAHRASTPARWPTRTRTPRRALDPPRRGRGASARRRTHGSCSARPRVWKSTALRPQPSSTICQPIGPSSRRRAALRPPTLRAARSL